MVVFSDKVNCEQIVKLILTLSLYHFLYNYGLLVIK